MAGLLAVAPELAVPLLVVAAAGVVTDMFVRAYQGQSNTQAIFGALGDLTGVNDMYAAATGRDLITQEDLHLTPEQRGELGTDGLVKAVTITFAAASAAKGLFASDVTGARSGQQQI